MFQTCEPLYSANFNSRTKYNVNQGGTSSAKTYTTLQVLAIKAAENPGVIITIVGQDIPNLKKGAIRDMAKIFASSEYLQSKVSDYANTKGYNKTDRIYELKNGSVIEFTSFENEQDARSGKRDYLFLNEANGIDYEIFFQLSIRTRLQVFLDYNPSSRFWVHERLIGQSNCSLFISDHRHNRFLSEEQHKEIESIADDELWKVYARGRTGHIQGLIYKYKILDKMPELPPQYGLDFGFNHKTALIEVMHDKRDKNLFWNELVYQSELTIGDLIDLMRPLNLKKKVIWADHAAADKIEDLKRAGFNVKKADKDVKNGIDFVKRNGLWVTKQSKGVITELGSYKYKVKDGITFDEPVKFKDDAMDAGRYGSYSGFRKSRDMVISNTSSDDYILDDLD